MESKLIIPTKNYKNVKKQQGYCSVGYVITSVRKIILFMLCCNG